MWQEIQSLGPEEITRDISNVIREYAWNNLDEVRHCIHIGAEVEAGDVSS